MGGDGFLSVEGQSLEYRWLGPGPIDAPTLVFLHEGLGCVAMWRDFPARLAAATGCGALIYSRAGYGGSDPVALPRTPSYLTIEAHEVLPRVLAASGVADAILVGHSDGATIALLYAAAITDGPVRGAAILAPHVFVEEVTLAGIREAKLAFEEGDLRPRLARFHGGNVDGAFYGWCDTWLNPAFRDWNVEAALPAVRIPLLIIQGEDDAYGGVEQVRAIAAQVAGPVETMVLAGCGHSPHVDQNGRVLDAIAGFAGGLLGRPEAAGKR